MQVTSLCVASIFRHQVASQFLAQDFQLMEGLFLFRTVYFHPRKTAHKIEYGRLWKWMVPFAGRYRAKSRRSHCLTHHYMQNVNTRWFKISKNFENFQFPECAPFFSKKLNLRNRLDTYSFLFNRLLNRGLSDYRTGQIFFTARLKTVYSRLIIWFYLFVIFN